MIKKYRILLNMMMNLTNMMMNLMDMMISTVQLIGQLKHLWLFLHFL